MRAFLSGFASGLLVAAALALAGLVAIGHALAPSDALARADAIVAISGDTGARVATSVDLWRRGYADLIVFSGGSFDPSSPPSAELMARQAVGMGVPREKIVVEPDSATTDENALYVARLLERRGLRSAILVTSPYHQRRAALAFAREFSRLGLTFRNHPADDPSWDATFWWAKDDSRALTLLEIAKLSVEVGWVRSP